MFEIFQIGPFLFRFHVLSTLVGFWLASELLFRMAKKQGLRTGLFLQDGYWFILAFLIGGRLLAMLLLYRVYLQHPERILIVWDGTFNILGGGIGIAVVLFLRTLRKREAFLKWLDVLIPSMALLLCFEWFGRFLGAVSYGKPTSIFLGVVFESMHVRYTVPVHPVQLYYVAWFLMVTLVLLLLHRKRFERLPGISGKFRAGVPTLIGVLLGSLGVIFLESFRGDFAVMVFAKISDFLFIGLLFTSLGTIAALEQKISHRYSLMNSVLVGFGTVVYIAVRSTIPSPVVEWRFSQFLALLAMFAVIVYIMAHRWKYRAHF